jgi:hypothetical protein
MIRPRHIVLFVVSTLAAGCARPDTTEPAVAVVAVVAGEPIYASDFVMNYELGFPHLRQGENPGLSYLQRVIDEKLLAMEGYRRGLIEDEAIRRRVTNLREALLVEQVFHRYVNDRITVNDEDIEMAMQRDRVAFKLRYVPAPSLERVQDLRALAGRVGFDDVVTDFAASHRDVSIRPEDLQSPYVSWRDISPTLLSAIQDLPLGAISEPVRYNGHYLLLQVMDVRRDPVAPVSAAERSRYEQIIFQQKARSTAREFIGSMMKPLGVRIKAPIYASLRNGLWTWYQDAPPQENLLRALSGIETRYADSIRSVLDDVLVTTNEGDWTVRRFLEEFPVERYPLRYQRTEDFENDLYDAVGLTLRDKYFVQRAEREGLDDTEEVRHEMNLWLDKWMFRALVDDVEESGESIEDVLGALRDRYAVEIHHEVLDTLGLSDAGSAGLTLLKGHTMRPAFPIVDAGF